MTQFVRILVAAAFTCFFVAAGFAQTLTLSQQATAAFTSQSTISSVTLDGTFTSVEGALIQNGDAHLVASSDGTYSISLSKEAGSAGEARTQTDSGMACTWKDPSGDDHPVDSFNCQTPAWFLPELPILLSSETNREWTLASQPIDGSLPHLTFDFNVAVGGDLSLPPVAIEMDLSSTTMLPAQASFSAHPDGQSYINIPVAITYQDYRQVNGVSIPFRVQKFVNGTLVLDITVSSANVN